MCQFYATRLLVTLVYNVNVLLPGREYDLVVVWLGNNHDVGDVGKCFTGSRVTPCCAVLIAIHFDNPQALVVPS